MAQLAQEAGSACEAMEGELETPTAAAASEALPTFDAKQLRASGLTTMQCQEAGFVLVTAYQSKLLGFIPADCKAAGFEAPDCQRAAYSALECKGKTTGEPASSNFPY